MSQMNVMSEAMFAAVRNNNVTALIKASNDQISSLSGAEFEIKPHINLFNIPTTELSLIHVAAYSDSLECFEYLLKKGQSPSMKTAHGFAPIHYAVFGFAEEVVAYLLTECHVDPNWCPQGTGLTPIYLSIPQRSALILTILLDCGARFENLSMLSEDGVKNPLNLAIQAQNFKALSTLLERSISVQSKDDKQYSPLMKAIANHIFEAVEPLIETGADVNYVSEDGKSALYLAVLSQSLETVNILLSYGADVSRKGPMGQTAVHWAVQSGDIEILKTILSAGANPLLTDSSNKTPLHLVASGKNPIPTIKLLLDCGIDINFKSKNGTMLGNLIINKDLQPEVFEFVLENGADLFCTAPNGKTYYEISKMCGSAKVKPIIEKYAQIQLAQQKH